MSNKKYFLEKFEFFSFFSVSTSFREKNSFKRNYSNFYFMYDFFQIGAKNIKNIFIEKRRKFHTILVLQVLI